ncbi:MAG TPA: DUF3574 domain-containing protein [Silvibacterium sp.]|nr:DUF3574 domain-containing protein [Silvibacterium sp.]
MKNARLLTVACLLVAIVTLSRFTDHANAAQSATLQGDKAHPAQTQGWVDTRLYFGLGRAEESQAVHTEARVTEAGWLDFLDKEVTPRFPDGLSVFDCYGQWQGKNMSHPERLRSKVLVIDYPDTPANRAKIDAIRTAWKKRTGDQSVLSVTQHAEVSF